LWVEEKGLNKDRILVGYAKARGPLPRSGLVHLTDTINFRKPNILNGDHTNLTCFNSWAISNICKLNIAFK
jgi:hypothetical protein